jgi:hypothetical protein
MMPDFTEFSDLSLRTRVFDYAIEGPISLTQEEIVATKPEAFRAAFFANELHMLVFNGGLRYYFESYGLRTLLETEKALSFIRAFDHLDAFRGASRILQDNIPPNGWTEQHLDDRWSPTLEELSHKFAMTDPELEDIVSDFIRQHPGLYEVAFKQNPA